MAHAFHISSSFSTSCRELKPCRSEAVSCVPPPPLHVINLTIRSLFRSCVYMSYFPATYSNVCGTAFISAFSHIIYKHLIFFEYEKHFSAGCGTTVRHPANRGYRSRNIPEYSWRKHRPATGTARRRLVSSKTHIN